jgi:cell division protein FtsI/penicillin-binding protein 2
MILLLAMITVGAVETTTLDLRTGPITASWNEPAPAGSLIKPFTALAYAATHDYQYPEVVCDGRVCWQPKGHGRVGIREAVAYSCNAYFAKLALDIAPEDLSGVLRRFGLHPMTEQAPSSALFGIGDEWRVAPQDLMRAYGELAARATEPGVAELLEGMAISARSGTGKAAAGDMLVKTGTAPCVHQRRAPADGYALALYPARHPEHAMLVRVHGATGASAAAYLKHP